MRGRRPEPEGVRAKKEPVRSKRKAGLVPAEAAVSAVAPPSWLKAEGLKIWQRLAPALAQAKLLTAADRETFGRHCRNFARWLKLNDELDREGETYETETYLNGGAEVDGQPARANKLKRAHPAFLIADRVERQLLAAEDRFGLNPAERQRIMAARAQTGITGDLFGAQPAPQKRGEDPATAPAQAATPIGDGGPVGMLN